MASVRLRAVAKNYGAVRAIHEVNLDVEHREFVVLVGPSGCGKSTLLRMIAGLETISGGEITLDDQVINDVPAGGRGVAMVFQNYALYPHMTAAQNMAFGLENIGMAREEINRRIAHAASTLKIEELLQRRPKAMSGGQRQRIAIGRAIVRDPKVFLFDEPLSNLDAALRVQMRIEIAKLHQRLDATMIYVTHDQVEAMTLADKIVVLSAGRIEQVGTPLELYHTPRNTFVAGFIGSPKMNIIDGKVAAITPEGVDVETPSGRLAIAAEPAGLAIGDSVRVGIRPEHMGVGKPGDGLAVVVEVVERLGDETMVYGTIGDGTSVVVKLDGTARVRTGETIPISVAATDGHLFTMDGEALRRTPAALEGLFDV
ncbi:sn-glycerol-3-phosphate ABC transporter ATP-binding protein UgpC [Arsenicitalea aurantiaca]|uniref:sn-glycerol-3-phosphate ABC transporter ATP-binding protein UgpC n=1 Tax=Arsenicitalea aurantiaca TaxID=1783274 RepID=A0A433X498_9HYPH|nr:sn-glycerol-3-phosphate ABC transporter ATP-binding protein UgpC [Arsenicitalea aurantiaca]RUT28871.1 sn-glycerol-3-phosphate ABC transporter ATP-binding protein UgpC [Arsenicitalea aurantiaca]